MRFAGIEKKHSGTHLHCYDLRYVSQNGQELCYEMVSRRSDIDSLEALREHGADAVVMIIRDGTDEHMLLIREYRMELGRYIYGLPGGLIEAGESPEDCARRELEEETGLQLVSLERVFPSAACTVGIGDEQTVCVFGTAHGQPKERIAGAEEIQSGWYSRQQVLELQKNELFGSWALAYSRIWADNPF